MIIYMVEVNVPDPDGEANWTPMYLPCYSRAKAEAKCLAKNRWLSKYITRVAVYQRIEPPEDRA